MTLPQAEQEILWLCAFRYALGRRTYVVNVGKEMADLLVKHWNELSDSSKTVIQGDLEEAFANHERIVELGLGNEYSPLGQDCDRQQWERVRALYFTNKVSNG
jgi:hypothetical protein